MPYCYNCGSSIDANAGFCQACGHKIETTKSEQTIPAQTTPQATNIQAPPSQPAPAYVPPLKQNPPSVTVGYTYPPKENKLWLILFIIALVILIPVSLALGFNDLSNSSKLDNTRNNLSATQGQLSTTQTQLSDTQNKLSTANTNLASTQLQLSQTQTTLASTQSQLSTTQQQLTASQNSLTTAQNSLTAANNTLNSTQAQLSSANSSLQTAQTQLSSANGEISKVQPYLKVLLAWDTSNDTIYQLQSIVATTNDTTLINDFNNVMNTWTTYYNTGTQTAWNNYVSAADQFDTDLANDIANIVHS
jgi:peptidoglycan hydrolase CwlO-like protein